MKKTRLLTKIFLIALMLLIPNWLPLSAADKAPFNLPPKNELNLIRSAIIKTNKGTLYVQLFPDEAPWHVSNFKYLADKGFYNNLKFHLYEEGVAIQTGAPTAKANSGPGYTIPAEFTNRKHVLGSLSMVRKPNDLDYNHTRRSHGSQFRIILGRAPYMDGQYVVFGQVIKGFEVLESLRQGDVIKELTVYVKSKEVRPAPLDNN